MEYHYMGTEEANISCPHCGTNVVKKMVVYLDDDQNNSYARVVKYCTICESIYEEIDHGKIFVKNWLKLD